MADTITGVEVRLVADLGDGNDPLDRGVTLPAVPRMGDTISIWVDGGGFSSRPEFFDITAVVMNTWDGSVDVQISTDGHPDDDVREVFRALKRGDQP